MSSSSSPCAACKFLRRKCAQGCVFAPYFPPDNPAKFSNVHRVFGASNVAKLLNDLTPSQREDAVNSLAYEAEARLHDPVYGCAGYISALRHRLFLLQRDLFSAQNELSALISHANLQFQAGKYREQNQFHHQQEFVEAVAREQEMREMERLIANGNTGGVAESYEERGRYLHHDHHHINGSCEGRSTGVGPSS